MNKLKNTKKGMLILSILLLFLVIGAASAADEISEDDLSAPTDSVDEVASADNDEDVSAAETMENSLGSDAGNLTSMDSDVLLSSADDNLLSADDDVGKFSDLNTLVRVTPDYLKVDKDYKYDGNTFIVAKNNMVIDFDGHVLDLTGSNGAAITVSGENVKIYNVKITGGTTPIQKTTSPQKNNNINYYYWTVNDNNIPFQWSGDNGLLNNAIFYDSSGALRWTGIGGVVNNSNFRNVQYNQIRTSAEGFRLLNSNFTNFYGFRGTTYQFNVTGNYIYVRNDDSLVSNCIFDNTDLEYDSNTALSVNYVEKCKFIHLSGVAYVTNSISDCTIFNCTYNYGHVTGANDKTRTGLIGNQGMLSINSGTNCVLRNVSIVECRFNTWDYLLSTNSLNELYNLNIINCTAGRTLATAPYIIKDSNFIDNNLKRIFNSLSDGSNAYFDSCNFINCQMTSNDYLIDASGTVRLYNCNFTNNTANGGLFKNTQGGANKFLVYDCNFITNNEFDGWAFTLKDSSCKLILDNVNFNNETCMAVIPSTYDDSSYRILYVSQTGGGSGETNNTPTTLDDALAKIEFDGHIYFVNNGEDYSFSNVIIRPTIHIHGNNVTVTTNHQNTNSIFNVVGNHITIDGFNFVDCGQAVNTNYGVIWYGGAGLSAMFDLTVSDCRFINNTGYYAAAIVTGHQNVYAQNANTLKVFNCTFINNVANNVFTYASNPSAGITSRGSFNAACILATNTMTVDTCVFEDNTGLYCGGVTSTLGSTPVLNSNFTNNHATGSSTNFYAKNAGALSTYICTVDNCIFKNNYAQSNGAMFVYGTNYLTNYIKNSQFIENYATQNIAGAIRIYQHCSIYNTSFVSNTGVTSSGAVYQDGGRTFWYSCNFTSNKVSRVDVTNHGLYYGINGFRYFYDCNFVDNDGGLQFTGGAGPELYRCNFTNNRDICIELMNYNDAYTMVVSGCNFTGNSAEGDGSCIRTLRLVIIEDSYFANNNATGNGGVCYLEGTGLLDNCTFINNAAENGGALYINASDVSVENCYFYYNNATGSEYGGGAIITLGNGTLIVNSDFKNNNAICHGGAIHIYSGLEYFVDKKTKSLFFKQ